MSWKRLLVVACCGCGRPVAAGGAVALQYETGRAGVAVRNMDYELREYGLVLQSVTADGHQMHFHHIMSLME